SFGSAAKTFCHPAVSVEVARNTIGTTVTQAYRAFFILMITVVPTVSAMQASSWLLMPNIGHRELIPPSGSSTPCTRKYPHPPAIIALARTTLGYHDSSPNGFHTCPPSSCSMNRPTRVPASIVVRMNRASNRMAKWYQMAVKPAPPSFEVAEEK